MRAKRMLETCLYANDLALTAEFYQRVLGLQVLSQVEERHVFFRCGDGVLLLFNPERTAQAEGPVPTHGAHGPGHVAFALRASDISAWREHLRQEHVTVEAELDWPRGGHSLYFRDPAGNSLELTTAQTWGLSDTPNQEAQSV